MPDKELNERLTDMEKQFVEMKKNVDTLIGNLNY
jgi:hypothetical protein